MWSALLFIVVILCTIHCLCKYNKGISLIRKIPGPPEWFLIGNALVIFKTQVELFKAGREFTQEFPNLYGWWAFLMKSVNVYNPEDIETIISTMKNSEKSFIYKFLTPWLGDGLLLSKGAKWQHRRKILTPAFHFNILRRFFVALEENSRRLVDELAESSTDAVDVTKLISNYALNSICETAMGTQLYDKAYTGKVYKDSIHNLVKCLAERFSKLYYYADFTFNLSGAGKLQKKYLFKLKSFTKNIIEERKQNVEKNDMRYTSDSNDESDVYYNNPNKKMALLDLLITAQRNGLIDDAGIQEEVDTFMFEGHDTTAIGLTYFLMLLANNKHIQDKIYEELRTIYSDSNRPAAVEDLALMKYLECCIKESLRLYPPVPFIARNIEEPLVLSGYDIPAGCMGNIHIFDLHRRADLFPEPLVFDPDRFLPENCVDRHPYAYIPFSAGPRNCIGQKFALMEMKTSVATLLRHFQLEPVTRPEDIEFAADLVLRATHPVYVKFVRRL